MAEELSGRTVAFLMANEGVEQVELTGPRDALTEAGATVVLLAPEKGTIQAFNDDVEKGDTFDPHVHEALLHSLSPDVTGPTCVEILQAGYRIGDKVLRPARVAVAEPAPDEAPAAEPVAEAAPADEAAGQPEQQQ